MEAFMPSARVGSDSTDIGTLRIYTVPAELFLEILYEALDLEAQLSPQLHTLAQVCHYWFQSIISTPRFWHVIDFDDKKFAPIVIKRNPVGPLTTRCCTQVVNPSFLNFMEMARTQAHRWVTLEAAGPLANMDPFDTPTPRLETLNITNQYSNNHIFPLSAAPNLTHVQVKRTRLPWDSVSLSGLKSLSIDSVYPLRPSLHQLIAILSASPALEWLALRHVFGVLPMGGESHLPRTTLSLPHLQGLYLTPDIPSVITTHLLGTINAPRCRIFHATIPFHSLEQLGRTFSKLASLSIHAAGGIEVQHFDDRMVFLVASSSSSPSEDFLRGWRSKNDEAHVQLSIKNIPHTPGNLDSILEFLSLPTYIAEVTLNFYNRQNGVDPARFFDDHPILCNSTTKLLFFGNSTSTLRFLSNPLIESGRARWHCPRLVRLRVVGLDIMFRHQVAAAVLDFLEKRSTDVTVDNRLSHGEANVTWDLPVQLEFVEADGPAIEMIRGAMVAEGVQLLVSFMLRCQ